VSVERTASDEIAVLQPSTDSAGQQYARLRAELIARTYSPGTVLLETTLSARYGVSRTPIREALTRLEQDGLLERVVRGYRVRIATPEDIMELYEARIALESAAAASAALRRTDLDLARLNHLSDLLLEAHDVDAISDINAEWHRALWAAAHTGVITSLLDRVITQMRLFDDAPVGSAPSVDQTVLEHAEILDAVQRNDVEGARQAVTRHLGRTRDVRLSTLAQQRI
jgi:DNA-binding GntR family transcriptional regulator